MLNYPTHSLFSHCYFAFFKLLHPCVSPTYALNNNLLIWHINLLYFCELCVCKLLSGVRWWRNKWASGFDSSRSTRMLFFQDIWIWIQLKQSECLIAICTLKLLFHGLQLNRCISVNPKTNIRSSSMFFYIKYVFLQVNVKAL